MRPTDEKYRDSFEKGNANFVLHTLFKGTRTNIRTTAAIQVVHPPLAGAI